VPEARVSASLASASEGRAVTVTVDKEGRFVINDLMVGQTYALTVNSKAYRFTPMTVAVAADVTDIDLIAQP
jgi:hypothetical protein